MSASGRVWSMGPSRGMIPATCRVCESARGIPSARGVPSARRISSAWRGSSTWRVSSAWRGSSTWGGSATWGGSTRSQHCRSSNRWRSVDLFWPASQNTWTMTRARLLGGGCSRPSSTMPVMSPSATLPSIVNGVGVVTTKTST